MLHRLFFTALLLWLPACTHTRTVEVASPEAQRAINVRVERRTARVALAGGSAVSVRALHVAPDVTTWIDPATGKTGSAPTAEVVSVQFTNRGRGLLEGLGLGLVVGAGGGALVGLATYEEPRPGELCIFCSRSDSALLGAVFFGMVGTGLGGLIGLARGSRIVHIAPPPAGSRRGPELGNAGRARAPLPKSR